MNGKTIDNSIHKGYDNFLNTQSLENLDEKKEFLKIKLAQLEEMELIETAESLKIELVS